MASFSELWTGSQAFRRLFLHNKIFPSINNVDMGKAEALWWARYPKTEWSFCGYDGCLGFVPEGEMCSKHVNISGEMPTWKWYVGELYRYLYIKDGEYGYRKYRRHVGETVFGTVPEGYDVCCVDRNPFNLHRDNLVLLSKIAVAAVDGGILSVAYAVEMDEVLRDFVARKCGWSTKRLQWVYTMDDIAAAAKVKYAKVKKSAFDGKLDPSDLASVAFFCQKYRK
jgi:hypothetical protein